MTVFHAEKMKDCHPDLVRLVEELGKLRDIVVICGYRSDADQAIAYQNGNSKAKPGQSKHNSKPSRAIDVGVTLDHGKSIPWREFELFTKMGEDAEYLAKKLGIKILWGGRFSKLRDMPHIELV